MECFYHSKEKWEMPKMSADWLCYFVYKFSTNQKQIFFSVHFLFFLISYNDLIVILYLFQNKMLNLFPSLVSSLFGSVVSPNGF